MVPEESKERIAAGINVTISVSAQEVQTAAKKLGAKTGQDLISKEHRLKCAIGEADRDYKLIVPDKGVKKLGKLLAAKKDSKCCKIEFNRRTWIFFGGKMVG